ncbi:hypothetical protein ACH4S8_25045 [Streptomyces sp. NPDC021080]|uniref:hypothetical protein n=1 Tax=Streptomyces sp. NPDC021080 TaxID=3365110 RepID=UPI0037895A98
MPSRQPSPNGPSLLVALWWLLLAACAAVMFLGGISFLLSPDDEPQPTPTVTVTEIWPEQPEVSTDLPDAAVDDGLTDIPTPAVCTDADARGVVPRDRWTPCGQLLGYFDDSATPPPGAPVVP